MSYEEKNITVSLTSYILIMGFYLVNFFQMYRAEGLNPGRIFALWVTVILATILVNILASILTNILLSIVQAIRSRTDKVERFIADERDKLIGLKGNRIAYIAFSVGVFIAMLTFALGQPPLIMFSLIILFSLLAEIIENCMQLVYYRRGV